MLWWIVVIISLVGAELVSTKRVFAGLLLWMISDGSWTIYNIQRRTWPEAALFACFFLISIQGLWRWKRR